jgi:hypothetical protein
MRLRSIQRTPMDHTSVLKRGQNKHSGILEQDFIVSAT